MKNILSLMALASMASALSYTVAELESMEAVGTPIRLDVDLLNDEGHTIEIQLDADMTKWNASVNESLPAFELSHRQIRFESKVTSAG